jgi:hypothetical protein
VNGPHTTPPGSRGQARVVWKFTVQVPTATGRSFVDLPEDAELLSVGGQGDEMVVWALVDPTHTPEQGYQATGPRRLIVANTGMEIPGFPEGARFLGTVKIPNGIIWHVWDGDAETTT